MIEIWKDIEGFEGYQVSNYGGIKSCRPVNGIGGLKDIYRLLKLPVDRKGYYRIALRRNNKPIKMFVHRIVLETFVGLCPNGMEARHLDGNSQNNYVENLTWGTPTENRHDRIKHGTHNRGEDHPMTKLKVIEVKQIKNLLEESTLTEQHIGEMFGVSRDVVSKIKQRKNWSWV